MTEEQFAQFGLTFGVGGFMLYMLFIILQLARDLFLDILPWILGRTFRVLISQIFEISPSQPRQIQE